MIIVDRFANMQAFLRVAETGGFVAAARSLNVAPSVVTRRVGQLEAWLGVRLVNRTTRRVSLSEDGAVYAQHCARILAEVEEAESILRRDGAEPQGSLRLAAPTTFGSTHLAPALCDLQEKHPQLAVELILIDRAVHPLEEGFDVVVRDQPAPARSPLRETRSTLLRETRLAPNRRVVCAAPEYLRRRGRPTNPGALAEHDCIHYSYLPSGRRWSFGEGENAQVVEITPRFASNNGVVMRDAARAGRGIALLPTFLVGDDLRRGLLEVLLPDHPVPLFWFILVRARSVRLSPKLRLLEDMLRSRFGSEPAWDNGLAAIAGSRAPGGDDAGNGG